MHVRGITFSPNIKKFSRDSSGPWLVSAPPAIVALKSAGDDDRGSAPGFRDTASAAEYQSSMNPPDKGHAVVPNSSMSGVTRSRRKKLSRGDEK